MSHPRPLLVYSFFSKDKQTSAGFELRLLEQKTSTMTTTTAHLSMLGDLSDSGLPTSDKIRCITLTTGFFGSKLELQARREIQAIFLFLYLTIFPSQARQKTLSHSGLAMTRGKKIHCLLTTQIDQRLGQFSDRNNAVWAVLIQIANSGDPHFWAIYQLAQDKVFHCALIYFVSQLPTYTAMI